jgi:hypothetical protein
VSLCEEKSIESSGEERKHCFPIYGKNLTL